MKENIVTYYKPKISYKKNAVLSMQADSNIKCFKIVYLRYIEEKMRLVMDEEILLSRIPTYYYDTTGNQI